ncbi:hypothetical protein [Bythopirellula polymerisocia]|uniref:Uncharacterized protein n=1 Tax=Bythopirellula polymerisocia TaxID=2528003 RepID=A0A5C6CSK9_9BACT|nr:hypothetical protein [Bythopirellula polymerisocia]TWU27540.1 hypothetical protein Pla144_23170 [Bythopirellula polymerisocia]
MNDDIADREMFELLIADLQGCADYAVEIAKEIDPNWESLNRPQCISFSYKKAYNGRIGLDKLNHDTLALAHALLEDVKDAIEKSKTLKTKLSLENASDLSRKAYFVGLSTGFLMCLQTDTLRDGASLAGKRPIGGKKTKKLATPEEEQWLREEYRLHRGQRELCKKISNALFYKHGKRACDKTVRNRLRELGLWETA